MNHRGPLLTLCTIFVLLAACGPKSESNSDGSPVLNGTAGKPSQDVGIVGIVLGPSDNYPQVIDIIEGSPASKNANVKIGMKVLAVAQGGTNGIAKAPSLDVAEAGSLLRGRTGTRVGLMLAQDTAGHLEPPILVELQREIFVKSAEGEMRGVWHLDAKMTPETNTYFVKPRQLLPWEETSSFTNNGHKQQ